MKLYHNPRCSKSRQTLSLLQDRAVEFEVIEYLKDPPSPAELKRICRKLGKSPLELIRVKEKRFAELGLSPDDERTDDEWLRLMSDNPILIERPIVVTDTGVALGRPPERVLDLL